MGTLATLEIVFFFFSLLIVLLLLVGIILLLINTVRKSKHNYSAKDAYNYNWISREEFEKFKEDQEKSHNVLIHKIEKLCTRRETKNRHEKEHDQTQQ